MGETAPLDDTGMVAFVGQDEFIPVHQGAHHAEVHLESGAVEEDRFLAHQARQPVLQFEVNVKSPVEESGTRTTRPVFFHRRLGGLLDFGMVSQPQIAVRTHH